MRKFTLLIALVAFMTISMKSQAQDDWCWTCNPATNGYVRIGVNAPFTTKQFYVRANGSDNIAYFENISPFGNGVIISAPEDPLRVGGLNDPFGGLFIVKGNGAVGIGINPGSNFYKLNVLGNSISYGWYTYSDERLKKEIHEDFSYHNKLYEIKTYDYKYEDDQNNLLQFGVMAQEMKDIYPNLVAGNDEDGYAVNYTAMIPLLIRAVQDQKQTIESLKEELTQLKNTIGENAEIADALGIEGDKMTIFPNPSSSIANISLNGTNLGSVSLEVVNLNGEVVQRVNNANSKSAKIDTSDMLKGVYFVRYIRDGKVLETKRLLIEK